MACAGVSYAVDLRANSGASPWPPSVETFWCPLEEHEAPSLDALDEISKQVAALIGSRETVYVHGRPGSQRAPLVACAVLLQAGSTLPDALRLIRSRRTVAAISDEYLALLRNLETSLTSAATLQRT
jgi:protein-tyrosine phosphatase